MSRPPGRRAVMVGMMALPALALIRGTHAQTALPGQSGPLDTDTFMALSQRLTGHAGLSRDLGARILAVLTEAGQAEQLQALHSDVSAAPTGGSLPDTDTLRHVLHGWYLGRITIDDQTHLTGFEQTLMGRVTADILPLRSYCGGQMGFWADPPDTGPLPLREDIP
jgi:fructose 5-dehydrogenase small subunit